MLQLRQWRLFSTPAGGAEQTHHRDLFLVWARCKWDDKIRGFLLEKVHSYFAVCETLQIAHTTTQGLKGLSTPAIKNKVALRASVTGSIFMDAVRVSHDALLPKTRGLGSAFSCLNSARFFLPLFYPFCLLTRLQDMAFHGA